jgi:hypothetical protein
MLRKRAIRLLQNTVSIVSRAMRLIAPEAVVTALAIENQ